MNEEGLEVGIKKFLGTYKITKKLYGKIKKSYYRRKNFTTKYRFINRSTGSDKLCMVLAGYKNYLIPAVMGRIKRFAPDDVDICIITSGKWSDEINKLCEQNQWSYLSTQRNNVALAQNMAIDLHKKAEYIFKLDEDIFITEGYFERMLEAYRTCEESTDYQVGVVAPILPINGYGHVQVLREYGYEDMYKSVWGDLKIAAGPSRKIESNPELARFMWGEAFTLDGKEYKLPGIDEMNRRFMSKEQEVEACPIRFSIGAILFKRYLWKAMNSFRVEKGPGMGADEAQICEYCLLESKPVMVSHNILVGHLAFGGQNKAMKEYFENNTGLFMPPEKN